MTTLLHRLAIMVIIAFLPFASEARNPQSLRALPNGTCAGASLSPSRADQNSSGLYINVPGDLLIKPQHASLSGNFTVAPDITLPLTAPRSNGMAPAPAYVKRSLPLTASLITSISNDVPCGM